MKRIFRVCLLVVAFIATLLHTITPAQAATTLSASRVIPDPPKSGHAYLYGWGATTLLDGSVLIGDYWNLQIRHFAKDGTELPIFFRNPGVGPGQTYAPYGLATDPVDGSVYVADTDRYKIVHLSKTGTFLNEFGVKGTGTGGGKFQYPSRIAVARDQRVFVADTWANTVVVFNKNGVEQSRFGGAGTTNGKFKAPHGMAIWENGTPTNLADDLLLMNDTGNKRVVAFNLSGVWQRNIGGPGSACVAGQSPQFVGDIRGLAIDQARGVVYVSDSAGNRVQKIGIVSGKLDATTPCIGTEGTGDSAAPAALGTFTDGGREATVDGDGNLWIGDMPNFRAQKFSPTGTALLQVPPPSTPNWAPPPGGFNGPRGVAVDADGELFVTDTYNQRVQKLNADGTFNRQWGSRGRNNYSFNYARMIATNRTDGSVWVADTDNHTIKKYDNEGLWQCQVGMLGTPGSEGGKFRNPHGIDVGADGRVYVADSRNARIQILDNNCNFISMFGTQGTTGGQLMFPRGIAVDSDNSLWVADSSRNAVLHFSNSGTFLGSIGTKGTAANQWKNPFDIALDCQNVYVVDTLANQVKVWSKDGAFQSAFGGGGKVLGKFLQPNGIDIRGNKLYVAEQDNERIQELTTSADCGTTPPPPPPPPPGDEVLEQVGTIGGPGHAEMYPSGLELSGDGAVLVVADTGNNQIKKYTRNGDGTYTQVWGVGSFGTGEQQYNNPRDVGIDSAGNVWVGDTANTRLVKLDGTNGAVLGTFRGPDADRLGTPMGLTVENDRVYVADASRKKVRVFGLNGTQERAFGGSGECALSQFRDVTADSAGNMYAANYTLNNIVKFSPTGGCLNAWGTKGTGNGQFANPYGVDIGTDGGQPVLFVADSNNNRIQEFNLNGGFLRTFGGDGEYNVNGTFSTLRRVAVAAGGVVCGADLWGWRIGCFQGSAAAGYNFTRRIPAAVSPPAGLPENPFSKTKAFNEPRGVTFDAAGNTYVADSTGQRVVRVDSTGTPQLACGERGESTTSFNWPRGVAFDNATGRMWVADTKQSRVQIIQKPFDSCTKFSLGSAGTGVGNFDWPTSAAIRASDNTIWFADSNNNRVSVWNATTRQPIKTFGALGNGSNQFNDPSGIGITDTGEILVADTNNNRIVRLTATASAAAITWAGTYTIPSGFKGPEGVDGAEGRIYVADTKNNALVALDATTGNAIQTITGFNGPANVAVDPAGKVVLSDTYNDVLRVFDWVDDGDPPPPPPTSTKPTYDGIFAGEGVASMYPVDISESGGDLYIVDPGRYSIERIHVDGANATVVDSVGGSRGRGEDLGAARAIAHDAAGNLYVADTPNHRIAIYGVSPAMSFLRQWGGQKGTGEGQFNMPYGIAVGPGLDASNNPAEVAYVADQLGRVQTLTLGGEFIRQFGIGELNQPRQLSINETTKDLYVMSARDRQVVVYGPNGVKKFAFGKGGTKPGEFSGDPRGIDVTPDGSMVLVTDSLGRRIQAFNATTGAFKFAFGSQGTGAMQFTDPRGLTVTPSGAVFVVDEWDHSIKQFQLKSDGTGITAAYQRFFGVKAPVGGFNSPRGLAVDGTGRVYGVDWWNQRVQRFNKDGTNPVSWGFRGTSSVPGSINFAWDVALQSSTGRVFVANRESNEIEVFSADGAFVTRWGSLGAGDGQLHFPQGVAFLPNGQLVVADSANDRIQVFSINSAGVGTWVATYGAPGTGAGQFDVPTGVSTGSDGSIWVADTLNNRIQHRAPNGTWTAYASIGTNALKLPWGVTLAPDGKVWVADSGHDELVVMNTDKSLAFAFTSADLGVGATGMNSPFKIVFGADNKIYVSDTFNNRILRLTF